MGDFLCPDRGQQLAFENSVCLSCGGALGFALDERALLVIASGDESVHGGAVDSSQYQLCANLHVAECNWLVKVNPGTGAATELCTSCTLTPRPPQRHRHRSVGRVRRRREGQAAAGGRAA